MSELAEVADGTEFRILGPLEVVVEGTGRLLPAGAERTLMAYLLVNADRLVPATVLVDALWAEDPPAHAANALQVRVSRLRRALLRAGVPDSVLATRRPGYLLRIEPQRVDAHRFERLVVEARRLSGGGSAVEADGRYDEALALWRGAPLADVDAAPWAQAETTRLTELWLAATEELIELRLAAGRHTELVAELDDLTARHPLQERLHALLMRALYGSGRQADALEVYQRLRRTLGEELGLDPSAELRALEQAILRQDPGLGTRAAVRAATSQPTVSGPPPVTKLPVRLTSFVGRHAELGELRRLLGRHRLVTLTGPGGAGKTSLAVETAAGLPGPAQMASLAGVTEPGRVPVAVAAALAVPEGEAPAEQRLAGFLRDQDLLVVLDNCEHVIDAAATLAETLLAHCPRLRLLTTSREPLAVAGEVQLAVPPLDVPPKDAAPGALAGFEAVRLFDDRARAVLPTFRLDTDTAGPVAEVCRHLDGMPLAIELAAARVKVLPVTTILARLTDRFHLLAGGPRTAAARQRTLRATVDWSHQLLDPVQQSLFRRLSVFRGGFDLDAAEHVCASDELPEPGVVNVLGELVDRSLVTTDQSPTGRFRLLETLREYAAERLDEAGETAGVAAAHAAHYTRLVEVAEPRLRGPLQGDQLRWLDTEHDNVRAALTWCQRHAASDPDVGLRMVGGLGWFWYFASHADPRQDVSTMIRAATAGSVAARAYALQGHAVVARPRSCIVHPHAVSAASALESARLFREEGEHHRAALSSVLAAVEGIAAADPEPSRRLLADAQREFSRAEDPWGLALVRFVEMELSAGTGNLDGATSQAELSLAQFRLVDDHWGVSAVQYHLGLALHRAGHLSRAVPVYESALAEARRVGQANTLQYVLANMGHAVLHTDDPRRAAVLFDESDAVARGLGADGNPLATLGKALLARDQGRLLHARRLLTSALPLLQDPGMERWAALARESLAAIPAASDDSPDSADLTTATESPH